MEYEELRYADGPTTSAEVAIDAPAEEVFALVSDITLPCRFSNEVQEVRWIGEAAEASEPAVGAQFTGKSTHPAAGEWETICTVTAYDPPHVFAYTVGGVDGGVGTTWTFRVDDLPTEAGEPARSHLTQTMRMGPGRSFINMAIDAMPEKESRILHRRLREHRENMEANVAGVKALAERARS